LHVRFAEHAAHHPSRPAIYFQRSLSHTVESVSYRELHAFSNLVATACLPFGAAPGCGCIGICLPRCVEQAAAVLAVLECGLAYVPIDSTLPLHIRQHIVADSGVQAVLCVGTQLDIDAFGALHARVPFFEDWLRAHDTVSHPQPQPHSQPQPKRQRLAAATATAPPDGSLIHPKADILTDTLTDPLTNPLMYLMYTSGTTGAAKAVRGTTRCALSLLRWVVTASSATSPVTSSVTPPACDGGRALFPRGSCWGEGSVVAWKTPLGFVDSVLELLGPLATGGALLLVPEGALLSPPALLSRWVGLALRFPEMQTPPGALWHSSLHPLHPPHLLRSVSHRWLLTPPSPVPSAPRTS
jgi:non-ribosomal peptide synthetase component F